MLLLEKHSGRGASQAETRQTLHQRQIPLQLLNRLENFLPQVIRDMDVDYIFLTRACNDLMLAVKQDVESEASLESPKLQSSNRVRVESWEYVFVLVCVFRSAVQAEELHKKGKDKSEFCGGQLLQLVRRRFEDFFGAIISPILQTV